MPLAVGKSVCPRYGVMSEKKILWIISELFYPEETSTAYIMTEVANAMTEKYDVKVICGPEVYDKNKHGAENSKLRLAEGIGLFRVDGVEENKKNVASRIKKFLLISKRLYAQAKKNIAKGDTVLMVSNPFLLILMMGKLRRHRDFTLNMLVHDVFPEGLIKRFHLKKPLSSLVMRMFNKAYSSTDMLVSLGRDMTDLLRRKTDGKVKIVQIENWADTEGIKPDFTRKTSDDIVIEYAGNIGRAQNLKEFVGYLKEADNPRLKFHIWGTGEMEDELKSLVAEWQMEDRVKFMGPYFRSQQNEVLNDCDIALVMLHAGMYGRGAPSKTYNIMGAGKPVFYIGPAGTEIGMMLVENRAGWAYENDGSSTSAIVFSLKSLDENMISDLHAMGKNARRLAETSYSREIILRKFVELI